jgi:2-iminobutanoate/2-iminopropanoate deaminase
MKVISTPNAPIPPGHYSQAIVNDGIIYISGQLPVDPKKKEKLVGTVEEQTEQVLANIDAILIAANSSKDNVLKVTVYISDMSLWNRVNKVYADYFKNHKPARAIVPTKELHYGYQIEIETIAKVKDI